ncbi:tRNA (guanosine(37)-N1)-methyltransferase TrmD [Microbacterium sp. TNHR37B]|uniref:tRNA (guanosine(37)-N1)-methyltransferase TrmD n=1 Tax=Microbacterium sp. TNHR37B TaxID=1775956 RepID=UPI0007B1DC5C|nr:tRNA (guanosine(37)-N1)-methyltransferase TrmD [Microbacterium sp. TNHR37B]KZE91076.1 tRNA (guanine-N(1)-)-methyltransferase [Microbacterium sp. TNHR37B]
MRVDVVTIFPSFFDVLEVSLLGKARASGILDVRVHDLRDFTTDRHRTIDDTPYGGGAGMVMKPEPWGQALDALVADDEANEETRPTFIFPSPAGERFTQATARELAGHRRLVFGCGRYEGIDERVFDYAETLGEVRLLSLGDYVLNGGEVAAMAMIEAIGRLIPGVVGNPESLVEESHESGLLEYPSYTKPAVWRGREVPPVLLSGHHGHVAQWRHEQQLDRTRSRRPDLLGDDESSVV